MWAQFPYDLILMDCQMPELDGFQATQEIRLLERQARRVPIVAVTASAGEAQRQDCLKAGMDDVLTKPFRKEELDAMLYRWLPSSDEHGCALASLSASTEDFR
jgi:CheY-like chemotaxis protein